MYRRDFIDSGDRGSEINGLLTWDWSVPLNSELRERLILESTVQNTTTNLENRGISRSVHTSKRLQNMFMLVLRCVPAGGPHLFASVFVLLLKPCRLPVMRSLPLPLKFGLIS